MNVEPVSISWPEARRARDIYREAVKQEHATDADRQLYAAYRAVARGQRVIDIVDVLQKAGVNARGLPKLAVCRAGVEWVHLFNVSREWWYSPRANSFSHRQRRPWGTVAVPYATFPPSNLSGRARVPFIPPQHRPKARLHNYHILWEAEWEAKPPVDPMLLKRLDYRGPFFAVLAAWDLTPLEQAVMRGL